MKELTEYIENDLYNIFGDTDISTLSDYQKREIIFDYLAKHLKYDWSAYIKLLSEQIMNRPSSYPLRDFNKEFEDIVINHKGVCIAIASYYKVLLRYIGIKSEVIGTNDETPVHHVLNVVYNIDTDTYSFDDVTSRITRPREKCYCFDYDIEDANKIGQGIKPLFFKKEEKWLCFPSIDRMTNDNKLKFNDIKDKIISTRKIDDPQRKRKNIT